MIFFVVYTAYEEIYRKTSVVLILFISFFIGVQYYYSLVWRIDFYQGKEDYMSGLKWSNIIPYQNPTNDPFLVFKNGTDDTIYF